MDETLAAWLEAGQGPDADFVERTWRLVLRREIDDESRARALAKLADGSLSRSTLFRELVADDEFVRVAAFDDALALAMGARWRGERPRNLAGPPSLDERIVEIPWCLARYGGERRVLDVGYAFAEPQYLTGLLALGAEELVGVDLAEAEVPGVRGVAGDVRELPFQGGSFDVAFCVSTLEHIGRDNKVYGLATARDDTGAARALSELRRVLNPAGRLLVTVPCGEEQDLGWQVQLTPKAWVALFEDARLIVFEDEIYELGSNGWHSTSSFDPAGVRYGERGPGASAVLCAELRPRRVSELARLAVRDVRHRDEPRRSTRGDGS